MNSKRERTPVIETERLTLRPIRKRDVQEIFDCWMQDQDVSRYMCWKASDDIGEAERFVEYELDQLENDRWNRWILEDRNSCIIGTCLIFYNMEESSWDISYNLGKKYWGSGYMTEAMKAVMQYAGSVLHVRECIAVHAAENPASGEVLHNLGFVYEKDIPYECSGGEIQTTGRYYRFSR